MSLIQVTYSKGIFLPEADLWLDPHFSVDRAFISHAHSDHVASHRFTLCSTLTGGLMRSRYQFSSGGVVECLPLHESVERDGWIFKLLPAGHIVGSAMLHLTRKSDGATLLYTGDYKLRDSLSSQRCQLERADVLVMESTFGLPRFVFPPARDTIRQILKFVRETIEDGGIPVLLAYSLGKAQEILCALTDAGHPVMLHRSVWDMTAAAGAALGPLPEYKLFDAAAAAGHVLLFPPGNGQSIAIRKLKVCRTAMLTGWALLPGAKYRYQVDEIFPLSDHADYPELLETVASVQPRLTWVVHGYTREFAADLRRRGHEAYSLEKGDQFELDLMLPSSVSDAETAEDGDAKSLAPVPPDSFTRWARVCRDTSQEPSRLKKTSLLADYLRALDDASLPLAVAFCSGIPASNSDTSLPTGTGWAVLSRALQDLSGISTAEFRSISRSQADGGRTAFLVLSRAALAPRDHTLQETAEFFGKLSSAAGQSARTVLLKEQLRTLSAEDGSWLIRLILGDLRMGSKEGLIEEAIAAAFQQEPDAVRDAAMLTGDPGRAALLARTGRLHDAEPRPFAPIKVMLASPEETAAEIWTRTARDNGRTSLWLEDKYDGIRAQLHRTPQNVEIYSRDLKPIGSQFPEILRAAAGLQADVIMDGEIIAWSDDRRLSFFDLQKRLGRRDQADLFLPSDITVRYVVFDLLWKDGVSCLEAPLRTRRALLEEMSLPPFIQLIGLHTAASAADVEAAFLAARRRGQEGLIIKDPDSKYSPGRRGKFWLKFKKAFATLDVVVVKAEQGHGRRSQVLSDYTFAVRDASGALRTIGKAYSGLTDAEIEALTEHFTQNTLAVHGRVRTVVPDTVLEIAFDSIQSSNRHDSGLAMRFPRIKAIRRDKRPDEIDTLDYARRLAGVDPG
jgi:DNA ligase-1